ncbi:MAG: cysteine hydrolase [Bacteroidetes bacterium]|nr:cysteine hydrolase [Bacteroidota bacterium]
MMTLIVIDMLNDFFERSAVLAAQRERLAASINMLVRAFRAHGQPVIWVRQEFAPDLSDAFPAMRKRNLSITIAGTQGCRILDELECRPEDAVVVKKRYSAFFGTDLDAMLARRRPDLLVLAGINTHACVQTAAIDAYQRDHEVAIATDCVASYDEEHHRVSLQYLGTAIARTLPAAEIAALLGS